MSWGARSVFSVTLNSGVTTATNPVDLGRSWDHVYLVVPTMPSGSLYIKGSAENSTYYRIYEEVDGIVTKETMVAAGQLISPALFFGEHCYNPYLELPTLPVSTIVYAQGSVLGVNYRRIYLDNSKVDFSVSGTLGNRFVNLPDGFSGFKIEFAASQTSAITFIIHADIHGVKKEFVIDSSVTQAIVEVPLHGLRYVKIENSSGCTDVSTIYKLICSD